MTKTARVLVCLSLVFGSAQTALAGPPLLCHPFQSGSSALLPWGPGPDWNSPDPRYDTTRLVADTTGLLSSDLPVLARMETLRRAAIYASRDPRLMHALLDALMARTRTPAARQQGQALALFDAGYLIETYRQGSHLHRTELKAEDGYEMVRRAIAIAGGPSEMEFAASLMKSGRVADEHRRRAEAGAPAGSLLARNLAAVGY